VLAPIPSWPALFSSQGLTCRSYNQFPAGGTGYYNIHLSPGSFNFSGPAILKRAVSIVGQ
jgi:hypothetical protein